MVQTAFLVVFSAKRSRKTIVPDSNWYWTERAYVSSVSMEAGEVGSQSHRVWEFEEQVADLSKVRGIYSVQLSSGTLLPRLAPNKIKV